MIGLFDKTRPVCVVSLLESCWRKIKHLGHLKYRWRAMQTIWLLFLFFVFLFLMIRQVRLNPLLLSWLTDRIRRVTVIICCCHDVISGHHGCARVHRSLGRQVEECHQQKWCVWRLFQVFCLKKKETKRRWTCSDVWQRQKRGLAVLHTDREGKTTVGGEKIGLNLCLGLHYESVTIKSSLTWLKLRTIQPQYGHFHAWIPDNSRKIGAG